MVSLAIIYCLLQYPNKLKRTKETPLVKAFIMVKSMKFMLILKLNKEITIHKSNNLSDLTSKRLYLFYFFLAQAKKTQQKLQEKRCHRGGRERERDSMAERTARDQERLEVE
jgi:hypothetical protein